MPSKFLQLFIFFWIIFFNKSILQYSKYKIILIDKFSKKDKPYNKIAIINETFGYNNTINRTTKYKPIKLINDKAYII